MQSIRLFIELRTSVSDALRSWSEFAAGFPDPCHVHFEAIAPAQSRLTLELPEPSGADGVRQLLAFKAFAEEDAPNAAQHRASA